ncbi:MAG TPA: hypothetical protein PLI22_06480 [Caldisericia bacterium]|nr:hypothetical protein [Caldisericia bacterium]
MKEEIVKSYFIIAGFDVLKMWKIENRYHPQRSLENPWWLVKTNHGLIEIGLRTHVYQINWEETSLRKIISLDDVTKSLIAIHAHSENDIIKYLKLLRIEFEIKEKFDSNKLW